MQVNKTWLTAYVFHEAFVHPLDTMLNKNLYGMVWGKVEKAIFFRCLTAFLTSWFLHYFAVRGRCLSDPLLTHLLLRKLLSSSNMKEVFTELSHTTTMRGSWGVSLVLTSSAEIPLGTGVGDVAPWLCEMSVMPWAKFCSSCFSSL